MEKKYCPPISCFGSLENPFKGLQCKNPEKCSQSGCERIKKMLMWMAYMKQNTIIPNKIFDSRPTDQQE